jgi:hypothetical protein
MIFECPAPKKRPKNISNFFVFFVKIFFENIPLDRFPHHQHLWRHKKPRKMKHYFGHLLNLSKTNSKKEKFEHSETFKKKVISKSDFQTCREQDRA